MSPRMGGVSPAGVRSGRPAATIVRMTPEQCAQAVHTVVRDVDTAWSNCPRTLRRAREMGITGWAFYVAGRGGALGDDARAETVAAALGFIAPDAVRGGLETAAKVGQSAVAAHRLAECCRWGNENFAMVPRLARLVDLAEQVVVAADASAMPLFAAWRAMPLPDDSEPARAATLIHLLEEHRAGAWLLACRACGLSPMQALIAGPQGQEEVAAYGWQPPYPARGPLMRRYAYAEALANRLIGQAYLVLTGAERAELVGLLKTARETAAID